MRPRSDLQPLILVVEDYADAREMYVQYLECSGYRVVEADNGEAAIAQATELSPDVILMDISLPVMDGWEAIRRLKSDPRTRAIPVVALSGYALVDHGELAQGAGHDVYVTKPCTPDELVIEIERLLNQ